ncbi:MAG: glycosyltransferase family 9 protein [Verrucomicrobia bacterium]|nr:glycosyltransferase family 9 protein [Verrucomicrobiota bacterium]
MSGLSGVDLARFGSALILKPSSMGDIVLTLPAVSCIKRSYPHLQLRWLCNEEWMPLLEGNSHLAGVIPFPRRQFRGPLALPALIRWIYKFNRLPREQPEIGLDFQGLLRSALLGVMRGARPLMGLSDAREGANLFHKHVVNLQPGIHAVDRYLEMARELGAAVDDEAALEWPLPEGVPPAGEMPDRFILLHPFSRGAGKSLDQDSLQALCDSLAPNKVILAGRVSDASSITGSHVQSLLNATSIAQLIWLLRRACAIVSVDSGPMHIAAALQPARTLGIHTWSDPRCVGPYDQRARVWKAGRIAHRGDFSDAESLSASSFAASDARRLADTVLQIAAS